MLTLIYLILLLATQMERNCRLYSADDFLRPIENRYLTSFRESLIFICWWMFPVPFSVLWRWFIGPNCRLNGDNWVFLKQWFTEIIGIFFFFISSMMRHSLSFKLNNALLRDDSIMLAESCSLSNGNCL